MCIGGKMKENVIPILYSKKEKCCGCGVCVAICPLGAIALSRDEEGFEYPSINKEICVKCGKCMKVCAFK